MYQKSPNSHTHTHTHTDMCHVVDLQKDLHIPKELNKRDQYLSKEPYKRD